MGHARALLGTPDRAFQERLAKRIVAEGLSVRAVEDALREPVVVTTRRAEGRRRRRSESAVDASGDPPAPAARPARARELLGDHLDTRVQVDMGTKRGKVTIEFSTLEDLERIYKLIVE